MVVINIYQYTLSHSIVTRRSIRHTHYHRWFARESAKFFAPLLAPQGDAPRTRARPHDRTTRTLHNIYYFPKRCTRRRARCRRARRRESRRRTAITMPVASSRRLRRVARDRARLAPMRRRNMDGMNFSRAMRDRAGRCRAARARERGNCETGTNRIVAHRRRARARRLAPWRRRTPMDRRAPSCGGAR